MNQSHRQFSNTRLPLWLLGIVLLGAVTGWQAKRQLHNESIIVEVLSAASIEVQAPVWEESSYE